MIWCAEWIEAGVTGLQVAQADALALLDRNAAGDPGPTVALPIRCVTVSLR